VRERSTTRLVKLEIFGFKSFADRAIFELGSGITALVGPNGSGKSNIVDALRWVFGEQNPRLLRGSRWEEVIFAGSASRRPVGLAEVSVVLDNTSGDLPVPYREVEVSRRLLRSGDTEYAINRIPCRLREIQELTAGTGAAGAAYAYVPQAAVDEILKSRPEDRRGVIEEAAGLARYRGRQQEADRRLAEVDAARQRLDDLIADIESQLEPLAGEAAIAERYLLLRTEHEDITARLWADSVARAARRLHTTTERVQALRDNLAELEQSGVALEGEVDAGRSALGQLRRVRAEADNLARTLLSEENRRRAAVAVLEERMANAEREHKAWAMRVSAVEPRLAACRQELGVGTGRGTGARSSDGGGAGLGSGDQAMAADNDQVTCLEQAITEAQSQFAALREARTGLQAAESACRQRASAAQADLARAQEALRGARARDEQLRRRITSVEAARAEMTAAAERAGGLRDKASADLGALAESLNAVQRQLSELDERVERGAAALAAARETASALAGERAAVHERWLAVEAAQGRMPLAAAALDTVAKVAGQLTGSTPRLLARLLKVEPGADKAVAAALGLTQYALVARDWRDVRRIIEARRNSELDGTVVLIAATPGSGGGGSDSGIPGGAGHLMLSSLVKSRDPAALPQAALDRLLGRFALVETISDALAIGAVDSGLAAVTRDGRMVLPGGVVVDGTGAYHQDLIGLPQLEEQLSSRLTELDRLLADARAAEVHAQQEQQQLAADRKRLHAEAAALSARQDSAQAAQRRAAEQAAIASGKLEAAHRELLTVERDAADLAATLGELERALAEAKAAAEQAAAQYEQSRTELRQCDSKVAAAADQIQEMRLKAAAIERESAARRERLARLAAEEQSLTKELADATVRRRESELAVARFRSELVEASAGLGSCQKQREEAEARSRNLTRDLRAQEQSVEGREAELAKTRRAQSDTADKLHQGELALERLGGDLRSLEVERRSLAPRFEDMEPATASDAPGLRLRREEIEAELSGIGPVNLGAAEQVRRLSQRLAHLMEQGRDLESSEASLRTSALELEREIEARFLRCFEETRAKFSEVFVDLFDGGQADLELTDPDKPLISGIEVFAQPPGKRMSSLALLSGGERALTAIALLFALLSRSKTGFSVLDEVDAHLDEPNCLRFRRYLRSLAHKQQFLVVTHSKATMEAADVMYGLTMEEDGVSRVISVRLESAGGGEAD